MAPLGSGTSRNLHGPLRPPVRAPRELCQGASGLSATVLGIQPYMENYGKSPCLLGKLTISLAIFNGYAKLPEDNVPDQWVMCQTVPD